MPGVRSRMWEMKKGCRRVSSGVVGCRQLGINVIFLKNSMTMCFTGGMADDKFLDRRSLH